MKYIYSAIAFFGILLCSFSFINNENTPSSDAIELKETSTPSFCKSSPEPTLIVQSDGSQITIVGKGNLNNYWTETTDGYTILRNTSGVYEYANKVNGNLVVSGVKANDPAKRTATELSHLNTTSKSIKPRFNPLKSSVLNQVNAHLKNKTFPTSGNIKVLALLIDYPDLDSTFGASEFDSLLYADNFRSGDGSFKSFFETSSDGQLTLTVDVEGWYEADSSYIHYGADSGYDRAANLVREAVDAAETAGVDFSVYDNDNDGDVDGILAIHAGPGAEQGSRGEYIWSHRWVLNGGSMGQVTYDGVTINDYMINPETRTAGAASNLVGIGVVCHEFGHNLGLPDLYDTDNLNGGSEGIGEWGLMGSAGYLGGEHRPGNMSAWSRVELGWATPVDLTIGESGEYILPEAGADRNAIFRVNTSIVNEYFLLENRQQTGLDSDLRGTGLAIWHINTNKTNTSGNQVNADENEKGLDLEEADGFDDLDFETNRGDGGDLFPGSSSATTFDDNSSPDAKIGIGVNATNSGLQIRNISEVNDTIYFSFGPAPGPPCTSPDTLKTATGNFTDGSGNTEYAHNQNCSWLIQVPAGTIDLTFSKFKTEPINDSLTIYNGSDDTAPMIGSYSGTTIPATISSSGNSLYIEFNTNATVNDSGWTASYTSNAPPMGCGSDTLTTASGTFTDGSGSSDYANNLSCTWLIEPVGASSITFGLDSLNTEISNDKITVYDGKDNSAPFLGSYSGTNNLNTLTSSGGSIFVEFVSNGSITNKGWGAYYNSSTSGAGCSGSTTLTSNSASFSDGSGVNDYDNNQFCTWLLNPSSGRIELDFTAFDTEPADDRVLVFDGMDATATLIGSYSGSTIPSTIVSTSNALYLEFRTGSNVRGKGWDAEYKLLETKTCQGGLTFTTPTGSFGDGSGDNKNYSDTLKCSWLINPPAATSITINFNSFDLEPNNDSLVIYNGTDATGVKIGAYSGQVVPASFTVNSGNVYFEFITNDTINDKGWDLSYTSAPICAGTTTLTAESGTFTDGSGNLNYGKNLSCSWLIQPTGNNNDIVLNVNSLDIDPSFFGDIIRIYDNSSATGFPIAQFFNSNPFTTNVVATSGSMFIQFTTNATDERAGWEFSYNSSDQNYCETQTVFTGNTGSFTDGSPRNTDYNEETDCSWLIQPSEPNRKITLEFAPGFFGYFDTELNEDSVVVYDGPSTSDPILRTISGSPATILPINSTGGSMLVTFQSGSSIQDIGWNAEYTTSVDPSCAGTTNLTATSGTFEDGSTDGIEYSINNNCRWLIQPTGANLVTLQFNRFETESGNDEVSIYDGATTADPLIGTYSGSTIPPFVNSSGGSLLLEFSTNGSVNLNGWEATYNSSNDQCVSNSTLTAASDTIQDGSGSLNYSDNLNCSWLIQPLTATSITLNFTEFDLDNPGDSVFVYDGVDNTSLLLGAFSGSALPSSVTSSAGNMFLEFITDASSTSTGWKAYYDITSTLSCIGTTTLTATSGNFTDGSGTAMYDNNLSCNWLIQPTNSPVGIVFTMDSINLANAGDFVRVYDGINSSGVLLSTFTNGATGSTTAFSGSMFVEFITDNVSIGEGWGASYITTTSYCSPNTTLTANTGFFDDGSPTVATNYLDNTDCSWLIQPSTPGLGISLRFSRFDTQRGVDSVTVYDGATTASPILATFSGRSTTTVNSTGSSMLVTFKTDGSTTFDGWRASYLTFNLPKCSGQTTLTTATGTFDDGSGNGTNYGPLSNCTWLIEPTGAVSIDLEFSRFATQSIADVVTVYDGNSTTAPSLGSYSGSPTTPFTVSSSGGSMLVEFTSNANFELNGWEASYTSTNVVNLSTDKDTITINAGLGSSGSFNVTSNSSWTTSDNVTWLIASPFSGSSNQAVTAQAIQGNVGPPRYAEVYVEATNGSVKDTVVVEQLSSGRYLIASPDTLFFSNTPFSTQNIDLVNNVTWSLSPDASWITTSPTTGTNDATSAVTVQNNTTNLIRTSFIVASGNLGVSNDTIFIVQDSATTPQLRVTPKNIVLAAANGSLDSFIVNSNQVWKTSVGATWLGITLPTITEDTGQVIITALSANTGPSVRSTYVAVEDTAGTLFDTVFVSQLGNTILIGSPDTVILSSGNGSLANVNVNSNTNWAANAGASWFTPTPANGTNNGTVVLMSNSANSTANRRVSFLELSDVANGVFDTVIVIQDTASSTPMLSVTPGNLVLSQPANSLDSFTVNSNQMWQATAGDPWLMLTLPTSTVDTGKVIVTAMTANPNVLNRNSFVAIQNTSGTLVDTVFVSQMGSMLTLSASPDTVTISSSTGSSSAVTVSSNTNWVATEGDLWFSASPATGTSNGTITLTANSDNLGTTQRISYLALNDSPNGLFDTVIVVQDTFAPGLTAAPDTLRLNSSSGDSKTFTVSTSFIWTATPNDSWIDATPSSATGSTTVTVSTTSANTSAADRMSYVAVVATTGSINEDTVYIIQEGRQANLAVSPSSLNLGFASGSSDIISITSNTSWNITNPVSWLTVNPPTGSNDGTSTISTNSANLSGADRTASLTISGVGAADQIVTVTQIDGSTPSFDVSVDTVFVDNPQGSTGSFSILTNQTNWSLSEDTPWLLINPTSGSNTETITALVASRNVIGSPRYANVTASVNGFSDKIVVIAQKESTPLFQVSPSALSLGADSLEFTNFNISSNLSSWKIEENASWMKVSPDSGGFTSQIRVEATETNNTSSLRSADITISSPPLAPRIVTVTQDTVWTVGINEITLNNSLQLYPNPTEGQITLEVGKQFNLADVQISIFSVLGEQMPIELNQSSNHKIRLNLSEFAKGIYFVRVHHQGETLSRKISLTK